VQYLGLVLHNRWINESDGVKMEENINVYLQKVKIQDDFWDYYINLIKEVVLPYQWQALNDLIPDAAPSHAIKNLKIAAGLESGEFYGMVFQDSDVAKWLEAVGYLLQNERDDDLEKIADDLIDIIEKSQQPDGYLNTYYILKEPNNRWTNLAECHELYCAGHLIEGAIAYYEATGKSKILDIIIKYADYIDATFGSNPDQIKGYDGHQEIELALVKLYEITDEEKYLKLSRFFLEERGQTQNGHFYDLEVEKRGENFHWSRRIVDERNYSQAHASIYKQDKATGHAVRFVYMCAGMAHLAKHTGDMTLFEASRRLWKNMATKQMYITGAIGAQAHGEDFTTDYDLPNDTVYAETCASIGLIFFAQRMLEMKPSSEYGDAMERALFNTVLAGMSRDGKKFFYVNPLEVNPELAGVNRNLDHVKPTRQSWFGCACCPPNIARLLASLNQYIYATRNATIYTNLYIGNTSLLLVDGTLITLTQTTNYPWDGDVAFKIEMNKSKKFTLALRIPSWCTQASITVNNQTIEPNIKDGYALLKRTWKSGDSVTLTLKMEILRVKGHPLIRHTSGKVAIQRGPLVYCLEEADNEGPLFQIELPTNAEFKIKETDTIIAGMKTIHSEGLRVKPSDWQEDLYRFDSSEEKITTPLTFIPYFAWANREMGQMQVWVREL